VSEGAINMYRSAIVSGLIVALAAAEASYASNERHAVGAKELFFDPQQESVASAARAGSAKAAKPAAGGGRRVAVLSADTAAQQVLGLSYWIELVDATGQGGKEVTADRTFRSGDRIRLHFRGNGDGRVVLVQLGSSGTSSILFPDPGKGLSDNVIRANEDRVLPSEKFWFAFDKHPGTEKLLVLFAKNQTDLQRTFPTQPTMDVQQTTVLLMATNQAVGSKDLLIETESEQPAEVGTYAVNVAGKPVVLQIALKHR
jgi:hypothetical protein